MRFSTILSILLVPLGALASPVDTSGAAALTERQARPKPPPCIRRMSTTEAETKDRAAAFAQAFIYDLNITEAFTYIVEDYINHNPLAQNGSDSAWSILSPIWDTQDLTPLRTAFRYPQSWLNHRSAFGDVVDRFRWEGGCIAEHWDQGEQFPTDLAGTAGSSCLARPY